MRSRSAALVPLVAVLVASGCGWFQDDEEKALEPLELVAIETKVDVRRLWNTRVGDSAEFLRLALQPAGDGNRVYAASRDGNVMALDPASGRPAWRTELDLELSAGPGIGTNIVVVGAADGFLIGLDKNSGEELWRSNVSGETLSRPAVNDDIVVTMTIDNRLRAVSAFDGSERWTIEQSTPALTMRGSSTPVFVGTTVIAGFDNGRLVAVNASNGDTVWEVMLAPPSGRSDLERLSDVDGNLAVIGQDVYAAGYQGNLAAIAAESGQMLWSRDVSTYQGVSADWNNIYTVDEEGVVIALARRNGDEAWRQTSLLRREPTLPTPFQTTVVVGDLEGYMHFFSNFDGDPVARVRAGNKAISAAPIVMGDRLFVQSDGGSVSAYTIRQPERAASSAGARDSGT